MTPKQQLLYLDSLTDEEKWISIEDRLPQCLAIDFIRTGYSTYPVKLANGERDFSHVADHNTWYHYAKEDGITHWYDGALDKNSQLKH